MHRQVCKQCGSEIVKDGNKYYCPKCNPEEETSLEVEDRLFAK